MINLLTLISSTKMSKIIFVLFTATLTTLSVSSEGDRLPMLTCNETAAAHLITLPVNCTYSREISAFRLYNCTTVQHSAKGDEWVIEMTLARNGVENKDSDNGEQFCVWMLEIIRSAPILGSSYILRFDTLKIGLVTTILDDGIYSVFQVDIRADVLTSPPFAHTPDEPMFWNFSSPLFRAELGWLRHLIAQDSSEEHYPTTLPGLAGSSVYSIHLMGSFGRDLKGDIPRFNDLPRLRVLILTNSSMVDLPTEYLAHSSAISYLRLEKNKFHEIPKGISQLKNLTFLTFKSLTENFTFYPDTLEGLNELETLILSGTRIEHWTPKFLNLPSLIHLDLSCCRMKIFSVAFSKFPKLSILDLSKNLLTFLHENAFSGLGKLTSIDLSHNTISHLPDNLLIHLHELGTLSLKSNNISDWPKLPCNKFETIDLSNNHLTNLITLSQHIRAVRELDISNNSISEWKNKNIFSEESTCRKNYSKQLELPRIRHNSSTDILYTPKLSISFVNISKNAIAIFSEDMIESFTPLDSVDLGENLIDCEDCRTSLLEHWLSNTRVNVKNLGEDKPLECQQPQDFKNRLVQDVNFENCFIPHRYLWLGIGAPTVGVISVVVIGVVLYHYRTEVVYLAHLAKIRAKSKKKRTHTHSCYDAFVCYSGKNRKWVMRRLQPILERPPESYVLCLFDRDFPLGSHILNKIVDAIENSRKVIVVLTQHFIDSKWCQWELEMAQHKLFSEDREFLVLLELEPLERRRLPRLLRFLLDTRPVVRWPRPETAPAVMAAAAELRAVLGPSLRQSLLADSPPMDEPRLSASIANERTPLLVDDHTPEY